MQEKNSNQNREIRITVDGGQFYSFARALKRGYRASDLGEITLTVRNGKLTIETARSGCVLACEETPETVAHLPAGKFFSLVSLVTDAKAFGPLAISFRPGLGEIGLPLCGTKARFA
jgi:hypothetical protein